MSQTGKVKWSKRILSVVGLLVLGAAGNGVWSGLMAPALEWMRDLVLTTTSLGIDSFRDSIYLEAAKGLNERVVHDIYSRLVSGFLVVGILLCVALLLAVRQLRSLETEIEPSEDISTGSAVARLLFFGDASPRIGALLRTVAFLVVPLFILVLGASTTRSVKIMYVNHAVSHYQQLINILGDSLSEQDRRRFGSRFAQIQTRAEFISIVSELEAKARGQGMFVPRFSVW